MSDNRFNIKYRIFKKERVRDSNKNIIIVPKTKNIENKNQIEFSWQNKGLEKEHLHIVGRVMTKEWERLLQGFPIYRAFIQVNDTERIRFFISFAVANDLTSDEIKKIISTALSILSECLEKVTKKVFGDDNYEELFSEPKAVEEPVEEKIVTKTETDSDDELIKKLHSEIEQQEKLLQRLSEQQKNQEKVKIAQADKAADKEAELKLAASSVVEQERQKFENKYLIQQKQIEELIKQKNAINKNVEILKNQLEKSKSINIELDKVNIKLSDLVEKHKVDTTKLEKVSELEKRNHELQKENSDYRVQCLESQSIIDQYNNKNEHLNESIEKMKIDQEELLKQAQNDYTNLEGNLKESHKKLILETNERQKLEIHIEDVRKKLAESILDNQEKNKQIKSLLKDIDNKAELSEEQILEISHLNVKLDEVKAKLDMSQVTNNVLKIKNDELEIKKEKFEQVDEWQEKYEMLQEKYEELEQEGYAYRQEVGLLKSQLKQLEDKLLDVPEEKKQPITTFEHKVVKETPRKLEELHNNTDKDDYDYDYEYEYEDFSYESDPYVEEVVSEELMNIKKVDQVKEEKRIKKLLESYNEDSFRDIKVSKEEYRQYVLEFKFLNFRWSQVFIMEDADKNAAFLEWCAPYIEKIEDFEEELSFDVKKSFFAKNYVTMDESTFNILKGYSKLSTYLDTYYLKLSFYIDKYFLNEGNR